MIIRILATKTSDRICAIMNLLQTIDIARHVGNKNIGNCHRQNKGSCLFATLNYSDSRLTIPLTFLNLLWKVRSESFSRRKAFEFNSLLTEFIFKRRRREGRGEGGRRGKIRKENIEYRIFDIHANKSNWYKYRLTYSSRYSWHFLYQVMFYGPFSAILHFLSHNRARIEYRWYVSRFSFRWVAAATNYTYPYFCLDISDNIEELQSRRYNDRWFLARCRVRNESTFPRVN